MEKEELEVNWAGSSSHEELEEPVAKGGSGGDRRGAGSGGDRGKQSWRPNK
jgi:hypothetical protein